MTVLNFLLHKTQIYELCVIRFQGWVVATAWIDDEDLFRINEDVANYLVKSDNWGTLIICGQNGNWKEIPCHYIDC